MLQIIQQMDFCKSQIQKYTNIYENLLSVYNASLSTQQYNADIVNCLPSQRSVLPEKTKVPESESESETEDLAQEVLDSIINADEFNYSVQPKTCAPKTLRMSSKKNDDYAHDELLDELEAFDRKSEKLLEPEKIKKDIMDGQKEDIKEFDRIDERKVIAKSGLADHENRLEKIYSREAQLLSQGLSPEEVRKKVREELYPEAIPANERKAPKIDVFVEGPGGQIKRKQVNLLAMNDDDENNENEKNNIGQNMPTMELPEIESANELDDKIRDLLAEDDEDDVLNEVVVEDDN